MTIEQSLSHPHEPAAPPVLDDDGRCLVCAVEVASQDIARAVAALARRAAFLRLVGSNDPEAVGLDDRLVRHLTTWLMKSGWVRDYEHARAESEGFAAKYARLTEAKPESPETP